MSYLNISAFLKELSRQNRSEHTVQSYQKDLQQFSIFFLQNYAQNAQSWYASKRVADWVPDILHRQLLDGAVDEAPWESIAPQAIKDFLSNRVSQGISAATLARQLSALRRFYRFLNEQAGLVRNPVEGIKAPKPLRPLPKSVPVDVAQQLLDQLPADKAQRWQALRDQAMFELLYSSGLRVSELQQLNVSGVLAHLAEGWIKVEHGKGDKSRMVPVGTPAQKALTTWLQKRAEHAQAEEEAVFVNSQGKRLSVRGIQKALDKRALETGVPLKMSPHRLRHACATHVLESSGDLRAVQELLGHANLSTTQIYTKLDLQHLAEVYDRTHPRAGKVPQADQKPVK